MATPAAEAPGAVAARAWDVVVVDAASTDAPAVARAIRASDPSVHLIIVTPAPDRTNLERALLFAPGVGEVWVRDVEDFADDAIDAAAGITRTRRSYRATRAQVEAALAGTTTSAPGSPYVSDAYLAALLQVIPDPILSIDEQGRVASWSPAAARALDLGTAGTRGRPLCDVIRPTDPAVLERLLETGSERTAEGELEWHDAGGEERSAAVTVTPVTLGGRRVRAIVFRDTTEQRTTQRQLEEQTVELEAQTMELSAQADELAAQRDALAQLAGDRAQVLDEMHRVVASRSRFYAGMSHEIRTPINAILGYNDLLLAGVHGELTEQQTTSLQRAQQAARHLRDLVNDVLDLSKVESGKLDIMPEPVVLDELVREVVATIEPVARESDARIRCRIDDGLEVETDPRRVRQILLNLLSNAVKFGAGRPVEVRAGRRTTGAVYVEVRDRGVGIPADHIEDIFEEFFQLEKMKEGGTGLGLSISRRLAVALGGNLTVASTHGFGSTFTLSLPPGR
ncbi:MAG TPA: PAS domain-containing sensor histidine kinase [Longimicrobiales bacterium]|nr:PAS domain-containing sensor histidine kinase [Longimicrobiales bacterium]